MRPRRDCLTPIAPLPCWRAAPPPQVWPGWRDWAAGLFMVALVAIVLAVLRCL